MEVLAELDIFEQAIEKLTLERTAAGYHETGGWLAEVVPEASGYIDDPSYSPITNDEIMVTLYRTIDAQLAILEWGKEVHDLKHNDHHSPLEKRALALAKAILGEQP